MRKFISVIPTIPFLTGLLCFYLLWSAAPACAAVDDSRFQEANGAYSQGNYHQAITIYKELMDRYGYSPGLLYNLANSYAQTEQVGQAVLNYERARKLSPRDPDVLGNLKLIREANGLFGTKGTIVHRLAELLPMNLWIVLGIMGLFTLVLLLALSLKVRIGLRTTIGITLASLTLLLGAPLAVMELHHSWQQAVVVSETRLLVSPFDGAAPTGKIQEGRLVVPGRIHGNYIFLEDETGRSGWIERAGIEPIVPH